ncbi:MAG: hypothetical protein N4A38_05055 [Candidatus Gracilibacteria bacterium]|nr:hypothetical protein [Candidatus Gracilibacteria bacterium]
MAKSGLKNNKFAGIIIFIISFFTSIIKSVGLLLGIRKEKQYTNFFKGLNFTFKLWPKFFWKKPTAVRFSRFVGDFINYIFYKK